MNPNYRFYINDRLCCPYYKDDLSVETARESSRWFFRSKLSGKLNFIRGDYDYIDAQPLSTTFILRIERRNKAGWTEIYRGRFSRPTASSTGTIARSRRRWIRRTTTSTS